MCDLLLLSKLMFLLKLLFFFSINHNTSKAFAMQQFGSICCDVKNKGYLDLRFCQHEQNNECF